MDDKLRYFCTIAKYENMSRAADEMHISQPALSSAMVRLEKEIGTALFIRHKGGIRLSEAGKICLPYAQTITSSYNSMLSAVETFLNQAQMLRIGSGMQHVATIVNDYMHDHPGSLVSMVQYFDFHAIKEALLNREVEIVLCSPPVTGPGITTRLLCREGFGIVMSISNPLAVREGLTLQDLDGQRIIIQPLDFPVRVALEELLSKNSIHLHYSMQAENSAIIDMFRTGMLGDWIVFYPTYRASRLVSELPGLTFVPVITPNFYREIAASYLTDSRPSRQDAEFFKYAQTFYQTVYPQYK